MFTEDDAPRDRAQTQGALAIAALIRADATGNRDDLLLARENYAAALRFYGPLSDNYTAYFNDKLDEIDRRLAN